MTKPEQAELKCDCCGEPATGVASSSVGPVSFAYCLICAGSNCEPEAMFEFLYSDVGQNGEGLSEWVKNLMTFKDNSYWTWDEWKKWRDLHGSGTTNVT